MFETSDGSRLWTFASICISNWRLHRNVTPRRQSWHCLCPRTMGFESFSTTLGKNSIYITSFYLKIILRCSCIFYKFFYVLSLIEIFCNQTYSIICLTYPGVANTCSLMFGRVGKLVPTCCEPAFQFWVVLKLILPTPHAREFNLILVMRFNLLSQTHLEFETTNAIRKPIIWLN